MVRPDAGCELLEVGELRRLSRSDIDEEEVAHARTRAFSLEYDLRAIERESRTNRLSRGGGLLQCTDVRAVDVREIDHFLSHCTHRLVRDRRAVGGHRDGGLQRDMSATRVACRIPRSKR